jgi:neurotransmitter:Na+ symporter, NSS family
MREQEQWNSQVGFVISGIGAAIGLGNLWLFPWRLVDYGGGSFLIPYFIFIFIFVRLGLTSEIAFGRAFQTGPVGCFRAVAPKKFKPLFTGLGLLPGLALLAILSFYLVVTGWIIYYTFQYIVNFGQITTAPAEFFSSYAGTPNTILCFLIAVAVTASVVMMGVRKGIEKTNKIAMPLFFILIVILLIRSLTIPGAEKALKFMFTVDPKYLFNPYTWIMALGQTFFTVCLGGMMTYGSYLSKNTDVIKASFWTVLFNTMASLLAALVIIPALFAYNMDMSSGPALLFITIPRLCLEMPGGTWFAPVFFICALLASISSAANLMETAVATIAPVLKQKRIISTSAIAASVLIIGYFLTTNMNFFGNWTDFITVYFYPFIPLVIQIAFLWVFGVKNAVKEIMIGSKWRFSKMDQFILKYVFPVICLVVIILNIVYEGIG